jgi:hypothetical protein
VSVALLRCRAQVFENEGDKDQVHRNPLKFYKPNLHVSPSACVPARLYRVVCGSII